MTSLPFLSQATTILFIRSRMSARLVATARMAMTSDETVIWNPLLIMKPSIFPPMPMTMSRRAWAQKSMDHLMFMLRGSMSRRRRFFLARTSSP